jgi:outer membrane protein W
VLNLTSFAQSNSQNGYYITWENDTIHGLINNKSGAGNSLACTFKQDKSAKQLKFSAEDIKAYRFEDGQFYISKTIDIKGIKSQVFVEFLVDGISNLYFYRDLDNYFYLIEIENGEILELYKEEVTHVEGQSQVEHDTYRHIRMLKLAFSDCMEIQPQVEQAKLTHKSLIKLTREYHNYVCDDQECIVYEKDLGPTRVYFAPVIGITSSGIKFDQGFYSRFQYEGSQDITYGLQVSAVLTRLNEKLSLQLDLLYQQSEYYGTYNDYYELFINTNLFQSSILLKHSFPTGRIRPSIGLGLLRNFFFDIKARAIVDNVDGSPPKEHDLDDIYMGDQHIGAIAQFGLNYRIFTNREAFTNFRYVISQGAAKGPDGPVKTTINSLNLSLGMCLSKVR